MRILLMGKDGQVGAEFARLRLPGAQLIAAGRKECDLRQEPSIRALVRNIGPDAIVNAAAYTAVDLAEREPELCFSVNAEAPRVLAEEAAALGAALIHYSTDYVFNGEKREPYVESDPTAPLSVYGASKAAGERAIAATGAAALILRTSWVYGARGKNFLLTMLRLAREREELRVVDDQVGAPTSAAAIAQATARLLAGIGAGSIRTGETAGVYHMTAAGATSWCGFARAILEKRGGEKSGGAPATRITPISTAEYPAPARRPANSRLCNDKFERAFGFRLAPWPQQLEEVLETV